jgi:5-oxoprolinase (ATP-hydrolysing)/N-methylhydantoinase A
MEKSSVQSATLNLVSLGIMWSRLINITEECWATLWRTAFSSIIGEAKDFACDLLDANGEALAHSPRSMPSFNVTMPRVVRAMLKQFPAETLRDGDVLITNDPWMCAGHLFDVALVTPVFRKERLVGFVGSIAHWTDIGGTLNWLSVREIYEEGFQIPPLYLYRAGEPNNDLLRLIRQNVRKGEMVLGDLQAQYSANQVGVSRLLAFIEEYGIGDLSLLANTIQERAELATRETIRSIPDGEYTNTVECDGVGEPITLPVHIVVKDDTLTVDWSGAPPQVERGGINCTFSYTEAHSVYALNCLLTPDVPFNAGSYRPITIIAPEGSILNCRYPVAVNERMLIGWYLAPAIFGALAAVLPDRVQAFTGLSVASSVYGYDANDNAFNGFMIPAGGQGASAHGDGKSALLFPTSAANVSVEMFETRTTLFVEQKTLLTDSAGPGKFRGGLGQRVQLRKLYADGRPVLLSLYPQCMRSTLPGMLKGQPGRHANVRLEENDEVLEGPALHSVVELHRPSQVLTIDVAGGSGYGDPYERPAELVQRDLEEELITAEGAKWYGWEVDTAGKIRSTKSGKKSPIGDPVR